MKEEKTCKCGKVFNPRAGAVVNGEIVCLGCYKTNKAIDQIKQAKLETLEAIIKEVEGMKDKKRRGLQDVVLTAYYGAYNQALSDLLTKLQTSLTLLKNER